MQQIYFFPFKVQMPKPRALAMPSNEAKEKYKCLDLGPWPCPAMKLGCVGAG